MCSSDLDGKEEEVYDGKEEEDNDWNKVTGVWRGGGPSFMGRRKRSMMGRRKRSMMGRRGRE